VLNEEAHATFVAERSQMKQESLLEGIKLREDGISRVRVNAALFVRVLREVAIRISDEEGTVTSDDLREYANEHGLKPHHPNAWGAIFRGNNWKVIGRTNSTYKTNHAREIRAWRWERKEMEITALFRKIVVISKDANGK